MEVRDFTQFMRDPNIYHYSQMSKKYGLSFSHFLKDYELFYQNTSIKDKNGDPIIYVPDYTPIHPSVQKTLLRDHGSPFALKIVTEEIKSSFELDGIVLEDSAIQNIQRGYAPKTDNEKKVLAFKEGLSFITDSSHYITEENLFLLYLTAINPTIEKNLRLSPSKDNPGPIYRNDNFCMESGKFIRPDFPFTLVPAFIRNVISYINSDNQIHDFIKASIIHYSLLYCIPFFDGNGRFARLVHLWYLYQRGYTSALFIPFSSAILSHKDEYNERVRIIEDNQVFSRVLDCTPFIQFIISTVYSPIAVSDSSDIFNVFKSALDDGSLTKKDKQLWQFVITHYENKDFTTKMLEKDFGDAAYATIRSFVFRFVELGLLESTQLSTKVLYRVKNE